MAKVTVSMSRAHLGSSNAVAGVHVLDHVFRFDRLRKARPTRAAVELVHRSEQWLAPPDIDIESWLFVVPVFVLKRSLRAVLLRDPVLFWRQQRHCLGIFVVCLHLPNSSCSASYKYDRETPWPVLATRRTMIQESQNHRPPRGQDGPWS